MPSDLNLPPSVNAASKWHLAKKLVLPVSLTLNLVFLAMMAGAFAHGFGGRGDRMGADGFGAYAQALDRADRRTLFREMRKNAGDKRAERVAHLAAVAKALVADPFQPEALASAMAAQEAGMTNQIVQAHQIILAHLTSLGPAERREVAARLLAKEPGAPSAP